MTERTTTTTTTIYECDRCGAKQERPFHSKGKIRVTFDLHDYQGAAVAGFDRIFDLCDPCMNDVREAINDRPQRETKDE